MTTKGTAQVLGWLVLGALLLVACGSTPTGSGESLAVTAEETVAAAPVADPTPDEPEPAPTPEVEPPASPTTSAENTGAAKPTGKALATLDTLSVKGRAPKTGYSREQFGPAWHDADQNGCDTRNDILTRDLRGPQHRPGSGCVIVAGVLHDPYTGRTVSFVKADPMAVQIDHVVALSNAWRTGARYWDVSKRVALANDPLNLLAVDGPTNQAKGDGDAATWLPPNKSFRCSYVARQVAVKAKYGLWVTAAEAAAIRRVLANCPEQDLPPDSGAPTSVPGHSSKPSSAATSPAGYYRTCADARAAGVAPIRRGSPLYEANRHLDRDKDGVACE